VEDWDSQPASQPDNAARRLGLARPWAAAEAASRKPYDVGYSKPGGSLQSVTALF